MQEGENKSENILNKFGELEHREWGTPEGGGGRGRKKVREWKS